MCIYLGVDFYYYSKFGQIHTHKRPVWLLSSFSGFPHRFPLCPPPPFLAMPGFWQRLTLKPLPWWPNFKLMQVATPCGQNCDWCKEERIAEWWLNLLSMQVAPSGDQICNQFKWWHNRPRRFLTFFTFFLKFVTYFWHGKNFIPSTPN